MDGWVVSLYCLYSVRLTYFSWNCPLFVWMVCKQPIRMAYYRDKCLRLQHFPIRQLNDAAEILNQWLIHNVYSIFIEAKSSTNRFNKQEQCKTDLKWTRIINPNIETKDLWVWRYLKGHFPSIGLSSKSKWNGFETVWKLFWFPSEKCCDHLWECASIYTLCMRPIQRGRKFNENGMNQTRRKGTNNNDIPNSRTIDDTLSPAHHFRIVWSCNDRHWDKQTHACTCQKCIIFNGIEKGAGKNGDDISLRTFCRTFISEFQWFQLPYFSDMIVKWYLFTSNHARHTHWI